MFVSITKSKIALLFMGVFMLDGCWAQNQDLIDASQASLDRAPHSVDYSSWSKQQAKSSATPVKFADQSKYIDAAEGIISAEEKRLAEAERVLNEQKNKVEILKGGIQSVGMLDGKVIALTKSLETSKSELKVSQQDLIKSNQLNQELSRGIEVANAGSTKINKELALEKEGNAALRKQLNILTSMMQDQSDIEMANLKKEMDNLRLKKERLTSIIEK